MPGCFEVLGSFVISRLKVDRFLDGTPVGGQVQFFSDRAQFVKEESR
jgi:hypothetical protein